MHCAIIAQTANIAQTRVCSGQPLSKLSIEERFQLNGEYRKMKVTLRARSM